MKRNILLAIVLLFAATGMQAQVMYKHSGEKVDFKEDKLVKMVFDEYGENNGDDILFISESGDTLTFDIDDIRVMGFAADFAADLSQIEKVKQNGEAAIVYDATEHTVYVVNAEEGAIRVFTAEGKLVKSTKGTAISVANLADGLYIVSYDMKLNAKIIKK